MNGVHGAHKDHDFADCVLHVHVRYLSDLTFIEQGSHDFLPPLTDAAGGAESDTDTSACQLINFGKRRLSGKVIAEIHQYQSESYNLQVCACKSPHICVCVV